MSASHFPLVEQLPQPLFGFGTQLEGCLKMARGMCKDLWGGKVEPGRELPPTARLYFPA